MRSHLNLEPPLRQRSELDCGEPWVLPYTWSVITGSVRGASHLDKGQPNQDAVALDSWEASQRMVIAVADGHGSPKCFRSDRGSLMAVRAAVASGIQFMDKWGKETDLELVRRLAREQLGPAITASWKGRATAHFNALPFKIGEVHVPKGTDSQKFWASLDNNPYLAYGSTLLLLLIGKNFFLAGRLGDGDVLVVSSRGEAKPLLSLGDAIGNETESLCLPRAESYFQFHVEALKKDDLPKLFMLSTDGYSNSFATNEDFCQVATDLDQMLVQKGAGYIYKHLNRWLSRCSRSGSGDDITVGMVYRQPSF